MKRNIREQYRSALAEQLGMKPDQVGLFWKGRVGLYAILQALGVGAGDEVILPAFTCVVVPNAVVYLGARPVYVDVDPKTYNLETGLLEEAIGPQTKCILAQNTFGLSADLSPILKIAQKYQIPVVEDCAHGFGGTYEGQKNGTLAHASFFSTQWNKPFSTGWGGFTAVRKEVLAKKVRQLEEEWPKPKIRQEWMLQTQLWARKNLLSPLTYWPTLRFYRRLSNTGIIPGSSEGSELLTTQMPEGYRLSGGKVQAREGLKQLARISTIQDRRKELGKLYDQTLEKWGLPRLFAPPHITHSYLKYPLLVKDRNSFFTLAERHRIRLGDWMRSPIHPVETDWKKWGYKAGSCPNGEYLSKHVVNLLTDLDMGKREIKRTLAFIEQYQDQLII